MLGIFNKSISYKVLTAGPVALIYDYNFGEFCFQEETKKIQFQIYYTRKNDIRIGLNNSAFC